jgi:hypothetical protein
MNFSPVASYLSHESPRTLNQGDTLKASSIVPLSALVITVLAFIADPQVLSTVIAPHAVDMVHDAGIGVVESHNESVHVCLSSADSG